LDLSGSLLSLFLSFSVSLSLEGSSLGNLEKKPRDGAGGSHPTANATSVPRPFSPPSLSSIFLSRVDLNEWQSLLDRQQLDLGRFYSNISQANIVSSTYILPLYLQALLGLRQRKYSRKQSTSA
jgi:hypothetical protein